MVDRIDAQHYYNLIDYGIRNLSQYKEYVNNLNVFPVPDGDTGSNMVMTLQSGFLGIENQAEALPDMAKKFSHAIIFGARGNSGVIISQFFKGVSEVFYDKDFADACAFADALENGVKCAYTSVANPVEGTVLTVVRESTEFVKSQLNKGAVKNINDVIDNFLKKARESLENTPELLPVLKSAGVVDSGGAGIVYVFEGMEKYLKNEPISQTEIQTTKEQTIDFSVYNRKSEFEYGYCTEVFIQLLDSKKEMDFTEFRKDLEFFGDSIVTVQDEDKVKVHIHTLTPEKVLDYCHNYGEFLSLKIENMSVQHSELKQNSVLKAEPKADLNATVSVVAVAHDNAMQQRFLDMGADVVMFCKQECPPAASDFIDEFKKLTTEHIVVFPNSKNTELAAEQAAKLYDKAGIVVIPTKSDAECYASLPMVDFTCEDIEEMTEELKATVENVTIVLISKAQKDACYSGMVIKKNDFVALQGDRLLAVGNDIALVAVEAVKGIFAHEEKDVMTVFAGKNTDNQVVDTLSDFVLSEYIYTELAVVETENTLFNLVLSFE